MKRLFPWGPLVPRERRRFVGVLSLRWPLTGAVILTGTLGPGPILRFDRFGAPGMAFATLATTTLVTCHI
jgi:hypothetical protein